MIGLFKALALAATMIGSHFEAPALVAWNSTWEDLCTGNGYDENDIERWCAIRDRNRARLNDLGWCLYDYGYYDRNWKPCGDAL